MLEEQIVSIIGLQEGAQATGGAVEVLTR